MLTKLTYRMRQTDDGYAATCVELSLEATGPTAAQALDSLRAEATKRLASVDAVAPPSQAPSSQIELVAAPEVDAPDPEGPGDSPAADTPVG